MPPASRSRRPACPRPRSPAAPSPPPPPASPTGWPAPTATPTPADAFRRRLTSSAAGRRFPPPADEFRPPLRGYRGSVGGGTAQSAAGLLSRRRGRPVGGRAGG